MMKFRMAMTLLWCLVVAGCSASTVVSRNLSSESQGIEMVADSIAYRSDLTRVYGRLLGEPHTSQRIDRITLESAGVPFGSTDIDGVDMERWFQWEEDGSIPVEIDFPPMKAVKKAVIKVEGPRGMSVWTIISR